MTTSHSKQAGLTLIELMISITLGFLIVLAATALVVSTQSSYSAQTDSNDIQDTARYALDNIVRSVRQAGYADYDQGSAPLVTPGNSSADITGLDAAEFTGDLMGLENVKKSQVNGSDVLAVRFFGTGTEETSPILNCGGFAVAAPTSANTVEEDRGWSIYFVNQNKELACKYKTGKTSEAIVSGVESFQVLYGLDTSNPTNDVPDRFYTATQINNLDANLVLLSTTDEDRQKEKNRRTNWKKVRVVKIALLVRGGEGSRADSELKTYKLFGNAYNGTNDEGSSVDEAAMPSRDQRVLRKIYSTSIFVRNTCTPDIDTGICLPPES